MSGNACHSRITYLLYIQLNNSILILLWTSWWLTIVWHYIHLQLLFHPIKFHYKYTSPIYLFLSSTSMFITTAEIIGNQNFSLKIHFIHIFSQTIQFSSPRKIFSCVPNRKTVPWGNQRPHLIFQRDDPSPFFGCSVLLQNLAHRCLSLHHPIHHNISAGPPNEKHLIELSTFQPADHYMRNVIIIKDSPFLFLSLIFRKWQHAHKRRTSAIKDYPSFLTRQHGQQVWATKTR